MNSYLKDASTSSVVLLVFFFVLASVLSSQVRAEGPIELEYSRQELAEKWRARIQLFLDDNVIPIVDFLSFLPRENGEVVVRRTNALMDEMGVALICLGGHKAPTTKGTRGYQWGYFIHEVVNDYPDHYVLSTNRGANKNWWKQKGGKPRHFIDQLEQHVRGGNYPFIS